MTTTETHWIDQLARQSEDVRRAEEAMLAAENQFARAGSELARRVDDVAAERLTLALMQEQAAADLAAVR